MQRKVNVVGSYVYSCNTYLVEKKINIFCVSSLKYKIFRYFIEEERIYFALLSPAHLIGMREIPSRDSISTSHSAKSGIV